jgi:hypothetical protein
MSLYRHKKVARILGASARGSKYQLCNDIVERARNSDRIQHKITPPVTCDKVVRLIWRAVYGQRRRQFVKDPEYRGLIQRWMLEKEDDQLDDGSSEDSDDDLFRMTEDEKQTFQTEMLKRFTWCVRSLSLKKEFDPSSWNPEDHPCEVCRQKIYDAREVHPVPLRARSRRRCESTIRPEW